MSGEKVCFKCNTSKPLEDFYKHKRMGDGHLNKCRACTKQDVRERRFDPKFRERVLEYDRQRGNRQGPEYRREFAQRNPVECRARSMLSNAVRDGKVERPDRCSHCHKECRPHGHHHDYSRPLDVTWLCPACHRQLHAFMDTVERSMGQSA